MKWAEIGQIPPIMIKAVVLREDRRFHNDVFPVPHRGNDNLAVMPQITKKLAHRVLEKSGALAGRLGLSRLRQRLGEYDSALSKAFEYEDRGGSSLSNQVMEMLYTKFITNLPGNGSFRERQIEQKQHELPASLAVDWFWSENNILEAYVNEIYGGHLYSDIRGFRSQAEIYFMKNLEDLNLREQAMLVAAIKKPSRIKEYALWLKASELAALIETHGAGSREVRRLGGEQRHLPCRPGQLPGDARIQAQGQKLDRAADEKRPLLLRDDGDITEEEFRDALERQKVSFRFAPGIISADNRLVNNIKRELDRELGPERSDSGLVVVTTIDMAAQKKLQDRIDRYSRWIDVDPEFAAGSAGAGLPGRGRPDHPGRRKTRCPISHASLTGSLRTSAVRRARTMSGTGFHWQTAPWDPVSSRFSTSITSCPAPGSSDMFRNSRVTYKTYSVEQRRIFQNYIFKHPKREEDRRNIEKYWSWSPRNFTEYTDEWISVEDALVRSVNGVHVQIQELVTPAVFARLLNEIMDIPGPEGLHPPYRSVILGGSAGDQRYDRYLLAYSLFPNLGILKRHTYVGLIRRPDGAVMKPDFRPLKSALLDRFGERKVQGRVHSHLACPEGNGAPGHHGRHGRYRRG